MLVIDENRIRAAVIEEGRREAGDFRVTVVHDMAGIARRIVAVDPDVVVIDIENPNRDMLESVFQLSRAVNRPIAMFVEASAANEAIAREAYRPDLYRSALRDLGAALPGANAKVEGALGAETPVGSAGASLILGPDSFFDGVIFDPDRVADYIAGQRRGFRAC